MEGTLAVVGFWLFMIALVMKKPLMTFIEKQKDGGASNGQIVQRLQQLELLSQNMAKDLSEIRQIMQAQSTNDELLKLKENIERRDDDLDEHDVEQSEKLLIEATPADLGAIVDKNTIRLERTLPGSADAVWKYFSDPNHLSEWLAQVNIQPHIGGRIELNFDANQTVDRVARIRGLVSQFHPSDSIAYSWIDNQTALQSHVSFELTEDEDDTKLVLTHTGLPESKLAEFLAVWHARLDLLIARLRNLIPSDFSATVQKLLPIYSAMVVTAVVSAAPTSAAVSQESYHTMQTERSHLLTKYDNHWRDADELEKEIVRLKHDNSSSAEQAIDRLDQKLKNEYRDLHQIELDIRELDKALL